MSSSKTILVVEDDESILGFVRMALEDEGYEVAVATTGSQALTMLAALKPSLILLDMWMPEMSGREFISAYRRTSKAGAPIVVMSASNGIAKAAAEISADGAIAKPFDLDDLISIVHQHARPGARPRV